MPLCLRKGCQKTYEESSNTDTSCSFHTGEPKFHEGLKSWTCCSDVNKPVLDFDDFMKLPGCQVGKHSNEKLKESQLQTKTTPPGSSLTSTTPASPASQPTPSLTKIENGVDSFSIGTQSKLGINVTEKAPIAPAPIVEDEDDLAVDVKPGTKCKRLGCAQPFVSTESSRTAGGSDAECVYHPSPPVFREGSKGYSCCKKRVLDFDDFLKIAGCKTGTHCFVKKSIPGVSELVTCRIDYYQTPSQVHATVFAKKADKEKSVIKFDVQSAEIDLSLPDGKKFVKTVDFFGPIDPEKSTYTFFGTKVDLTLQKADSRSWNLLERPPTDGSVSLPPGYGLTFGVSGRTGSVGGKAPVLDPRNSA